MFKFSHDFSAPSSGDGQEFLLDTTVFEPSPSVDGSLLSTQKIVLYESGGLKDDTGFFEKKPYSYSFPLNERIIPIGSDSTLFEDTGPISLDRESYHDKNYYGDSMFDQKNLLEKFREIPFKNRLKMMVDERPSEFSYNTDTGLVHHVPSNSMFGPISMFLDEIDSAVNMPDVSRYAIAWVFCMLLAAPFLSTNVSSIVNDDFCFLPAVDGSGECALGLHYSFSNGHIQKVNSSVSDSNMATDSQVQAVPVENSVPVNINSSSSRTLPNTKKSGQ